MNNINLLQRWLSSLLLFPCIERNKSFNMYVNNQQSGIEFTVGRQKASFFLQFVLIGSIFCLFFSQSILAENLPFDRTNPIIIDNDGNIDTYTCEFGMGLNSSGSIDLKAITSLSAGHYQLFVEMARRSGMKNVPDSDKGAGGVALVKPSSGVIEDTVPYNTAGSQKIKDVVLAASPSKPVVVCTGGPLTNVADAYLLADDEGNGQAFVDRVIVCANVGNTNNMKDYNGSVDGWAANIVLKKLKLVAIPLDDALNAPVVTKSRLQGNEIFDRELRRHMIDKEQNNGLPSNRDGDGPPLIAVLKPIQGDYVISTKHVKHGGWTSPSPSGGLPTSHDEVPVYQDTSDPFGPGTAIIVTGWDQTVATDTWWAEMSKSSVWNGSFSQQSPFNGLQATLNGRIEAEEFDYGGQGWASNDTEFNGWKSTWKRTLERPDLEAFNGDPVNGIYVTQIDNGEWLEYTVNAPSTGIYNGTARVFANGGSFRIEIDGTNVTGTINVPTGGGFQTISLPDFTLNPSGQKVMRIYFEMGGFDIDWLDFTAPGLVQEWMDDFSTDTTGNYTVTDTSFSNNNGPGSFNYDSVNERAQVLTGDNIGLQFSQSVASLSSGSFSIDFLPTTKYPQGGWIEIRLKQDANNYYELSNSDGYGPYQMRKIVGGVEVENVAFTNGYIQNTNYTITINFSPNQTNVTAFGNNLSLITDTSTISVNSFEIETSQQDAFYDNILLNSTAITGFVQNSGFEDGSLTPWGSWA